MSVELHVSRDGRTLVEMVDEELQASGINYEDHPSFSISLPQEASKRTEIRSNRRGRHRTEGEEATQLELRKEL